MKQFTHHFHFQLLLSFYNFELYILYIPIGQGSVSFEIYSHHFRTLLLIIGFKTFFLNGHFRDDLLPAAVLQVVSPFSLSFSPFPDTWIWKPKPSGSFSISSVYSVIRSHHFPVLYLAWVWSRQLLVKVSIFFWRVMNCLLPFPEVLRCFGF